MRGCTPADNQTPGTPRRESEREAVGKSPADAKAPTVFISYSHDSIQHEDRVLELANRLRTEGIDAMIDQYLNEPPAEGWRIWMETQIRNSDFVLMVCSETYFRRVMKQEEAGHGLGACYEAQIILQIFYEDQCRNTKFLPVLFEDGRVEHIPTPLRDFDRYRMNAEDEYLRLYRRITKQPATVRPELGAIRNLPVHKRGHLDFIAGGGVQSDTSAAEVGPGIGASFVPGNPLRMSDDRWSNIAPYALISLVSFLVGAGLLALMFWNAEKLVALGLTGNLFYIVLLPLGLSAAAFLFGVLRSFAAYRGEHLGGVLELGGPIIAFALVVIGGFVLVPSPLTFPLTVYVHGERGPSDLVLRDFGHVLLDLGGDRRSEPIGGNGQAYFPTVPANFRGQEVLAWVESDSFESVGGAQKKRLDGPSLYLPVRKKNGRVAGRIRDPIGNALAGVEIQVAGVSTSTDRTGHFELTIPGDRLKPDLELYAVALGYAPEHYTVTANANEIVIDLKPSR